MGIRHGYYWVRPLRSVGSLVEGQLEIVEVSECGNYVFSIGEEFSDSITTFHFIKPIPKP
mgnify:CR=1 FL=1